MTGVARSPLEFRSRDRWLVHLERVAACWPGGRCAPLAEVTPWGESVFLPARPWYSDEQLSAIEDQQFRWSSFLRAGANGG